jgi:hypothetical protein
MILELDLFDDGSQISIPPRMIKVLRICPKRVLDGLPLSEIENYVALRKGLIR